MAAQRSGSFILTRFQQPPFQISLFGFRNQSASFTEEETVLTNQEENIISLLAGQNFTLKLEVKNGLCNYLFLLDGLNCFYFIFFKQIFNSLLQIHLIICVNAP